MSLVGAEILRLRTEEDAPFRGHALLIGAPLAGLKGVAECLATMRGWLVSRGFVEVEPRVRSEAEEIERQMSALLDEVAPGDWVLVYYAGHGMQVLPQAEGAPRPLAVLLPIDAFDSEVAIAGDTWIRGVAELSRKVAPPRGDGPGVALVLECCHALALLERWPDQAEREAVMARVRESLGRRRFRDPTDPLPGVVRVLATGRDERADVGEMTSALVRQLSEHPEEPWWALMDRLRAGWSKAQQHPGVSGPVERVPLSDDRFTRPVGLVPCAWRGEAWRVESGGAMGWTSHRRLALSPSLRLPARAWAQLDSNSASLRIVDPPGPRGGIAGDFAWAWAAPRGRRAIVAVGGDDLGRQRELMRRLGARVRRVLEIPQGGGAEEHAGRIRFVVKGNAVEIYDQWGDFVARTSLRDEDAWSAWIDRLLSLEDWLALAEAGSSWPQDAIALRWGTWRGGERVPWSRESPTIDGSAPLWIEVVAEAWVRARVSLFRIRADRGVDALSGFAPGGLSLGGRTPGVMLGSEDDPLRFAWPSTPTVGEPRTEVLVAVVCDRPLPLSLLARGPVGSPAMRAVFRGEEEERPLRLTMLALPYRLSPSVGVREESGGRAVTAGRLGAVYG